MKEIVNQYHPDGLWFDWYTMGLHPSENVVAEFLRQYSPETVFTFNFTNQFAEEIQKHPESLKESQKDRAHACSWNPIHRSSGGRKFLAHRTALAPSS
jgi:hypothetical protein